MWAFLTALATAIIAALATYFGNQRADAAKVDTAKDEAVKDAATETQEIVKEAADARSALRPIDDLDALHAELQRKRQERGG